VQCLNYLTYSLTYCVGYLRLTSRKLVLRQIAHARGLIARAQEDPTYELPEVWHQVLFTAAHRCVVLKCFGRR